MRTKKERNTVQISKDSKDSSVCAVYHSSKQAFQAHTLLLFTHTELAEECISTAVDEKAKQKYFY